MGNSILDELLEELGGFGEDLLKGLNKTDSRPRTEPKSELTEEQRLVEGLKGAYSQAIEQDNGTLLVQVLPKREEQIISLGDADLLSLSAKASAKVGLYESGMNFLRAIEPPHAGHRAALGVFEYVSEDYARAVEHLGGARDASCVLLYSAASAKDGNLDVKFHRTVLTDLLEGDSAVAHHFMGTIYAQNESAKAQIFLGTAARLKPESQNYQLDLLRSMKQNGQDVPNRLLSDFYRNTGSTLSPQDLSAELEERVIVVPNLAVKPYSIIDRLL